MNIWKRYSMRVSKNWVKFNKMFTLSPCHMNELIQLSETASARSVELVDDLIDFASQANQAALLHRDLSCDLAFPELRAIAAFKPFLSSVNLVKEGSVN